MANKIILSGGSKVLKPIITEILAISQLVEEIEVLTTLGREPSTRRNKKPQITLFFTENYEDVDPNYRRVKGEISIRLMGETTGTITKEKLKVYIQKIKSKFAEPPFVWKKGKHMASYADWDKGYQLQILCTDKVEGKRVIEQVLDIQNHSPNWEYLNFITNDEPMERYPTIPHHQEILGELVRLPRERPMANVVFRYAKMVLHGLERPITLVDTGGLLPAPPVELD